MDLSDFYILWLSVLYPTVPRGIPCVRGPRSDTLCTMSAATVQGPRSSQRHKSSHSANGRPPREEDWERHRETIKRLYLDKKKPLREVMVIMAREHGHKAT